MQKPLAQMLLKHSTFIVQGSPVFLTQVFLLSPSGSAHLPLAQS